MCTCSMPESKAKGLLELSQWAMSRIDDTHFCEYGVLSSRWLALSSTACKSSMQGRIIGEPAGGFGETLDGVIGLGMADIPDCTVS